MIRKTLILIILLSGLPALATPPDVMSLRDRIFGISATHVYILRDINDNLGLHNPGMTDTYLVAKSIKTGQDEAHWPVTRWYRGYDVTDDKDILQYFPLSGAVNPFQILSDANALPIARAMRQPDNRFAPEIWLTPDGLQIESRSLPLDAVFAQMRASINVSRATVQPYPQSGFVSQSFSDPQDMMGDIELAFDWCELDAALSLSVTYDMPETQLARIRCAGDSMQSANLIVLIPTGKAEN